MPDARYEYATEAVSVYPNSLDETSFDRMLNDYADDGWAFDEVAVVGASTLLFIFRRPAAAGE